MDDEKKYEEALERAKKYHTPDSNNTNLKAVLENIFPELAESEDERTRKELIELVSWSKINVIAPIEVSDADKALAWLEKQKIPKGSPTPDLMTMLVPNRYNEQKPAEWSEEDEREINGILCILESWDRCHTAPGGIPSLVPEYVSWLKSLRPQPKQEWSEEDKLNLQGIIDEIEANKNTAPSYDIPTYDRFLSWLKSLRPQPHWKPSEEQIGILGKVFAGCELNTTERDSMVDLFYHLKDMI